MHHVEPYGRVADYPRYGRLASVTGRSSSATRERNIPENVSESDGPAARN